MKVALRGSHVEFVIFRGFNEQYPMWLAEEIYCNDFFDESRFTSWFCKNTRSIEYYDKKLVLEDSIFLRKSSGDIFVTDMDKFEDSYTTFVYNEESNSGIAAFNEDCIDYVECRAGVLVHEYPEWFYEYFTEAVNHPYEETIFILDKKNRSISNMDIRNGEVVVTEHCVFLRNKFGEIMGMGYGDFVKYYDPNPEELS